MRWRRYGKHGEENEPMRNKIRNRLAASVALISLAALTLTACGATTSTTTPTPTNIPSSQPTATTPTTTPGGQQTQVGAIGQTITVQNKWQITVVNFRLFTPDNRTPTVGNRFIAAEVNVKNISTASAKLSDMGHFTLSNAAGTSYTAVYVGGISLDLNESLDPGEQHHAVVAFEAPTSVSQFILAFTGPGTQTSQVYVRWNLSL